MNTFTHSNHVLVLEDDNEVAAPYIKALSRNDYFPVHVQNLAELKKVIMKQAFIGAYIDIRLDEDDDQNVDGLYAMDIIKKVDPNTVCIVVTGHGNFDIARQSLKKYNAYDVRKKEETDFILFIKQLNEAISGLEVKGIEKYDVMRSLSKDHYVFSWEEKIISAIKPKAGLDSVYKVIPNVFLKLFPVLVDDISPILVPEQSLLYAACQLWSRNIGKKVMVVFGDATVIDKILTDNFVKFRNETIQFSNLLYRESDANLTGVIIETENQSFDHTWIPFMVNSKS